MLKGFDFSVRDRIMMVLALALILFIGIIAAATISLEIGFMLILFDFLLAVIVILSGQTTKETLEGNLVHQGRYTVEDIEVSQSPDRTEPVNS